MTSKKHSEALFSALDRLAAEDRLSHVTTALMSDYSQVSEGVIFRHFASKEAVLEAWVVSRIGRLQTQLAGMAPGRAGLMRFIADQFVQGHPAAFLCCQLMDCAALREHVEAARARMRAVLAQRVGALSGLPSDVTQETLADMLWLDICRAWKEPEGEVAIRLKRLLPWEADNLLGRHFPAPEVLGRLALSNSGFVFDPVSGASYTVNVSGLAILRALQGGCNDVAEMVATLEGEFEVPHAVLEREVIEFASRLRGVFR